MSLHGQSARQDHLAAEPVVVVALEAPGEEGPGDEVAGVGVGACQTAFSVGLMLRL